MTEWIKWKHIMIEQPKDGESIVQVDRPYQGHYTMGMRNYSQKCTYQDVLDYCIQNDLSYPDFWWISADEFPFPDKELK